MADMPKPGMPQTGQQQQPAPDQGKDPRMDAREGQSVATLQALVEQQIDDYMKAQGQNGQAISLPEILADEKGPFAAKARELGLDKEFQTFKSKIPQIAAWRQELVAVAEQIQAGMGSTAGQNPQGQTPEQNAQATQNPQAELQKKIEDEAGAVKKAGRIGGIVSAMLGGAASGLATIKFSNKGNIFKVAMTALGAAVAGGVGAVFAAKRRANKSADTILAMQEKLEQAGPMAAAMPGVDPGLEAKAQDLYSKMENAQAEAISPLLDAMMERMQMEMGAQAPTVAQEAGEGIGKFEAMLKEETAAREATGQRPEASAVGGQGKSFAAAETQSGSHQEALRVQRLHAEQGAAMSK